MNAGELESESSRRKGPSYGDPLGTHQEDFRRLGLLATSVIDVTRPIQEPEASRSPFQTTRCCCSIPLARSLTGHNIRNVYAVKPQPNLSPAVEHSKTMSRFEKTVKYSWN
jgi:hypothetical protein